MARVLILTHDGLFGRRLSTLISAYGIDADPCQSLGEATLKLRDFHYHAVVVDIGENSMDPADAIGYLVKPIDEREYIEAVNRALQYSSSFAGYGI